jgi:large subunit ribosomal protein L10
MARKAIFFYFVRKIHMANSIRNKKNDEVAVMQKKFNNAEILLLAQNKGLNAKATNELRVATRAVGVDYRVAKNTLAILAVKGTAFESMADQMNGPTAYITGSDPVATAKVIAEFAKKNDKLVVVAAKFGDMVMNAEQVIAFSKLPTLDEIRSKLVGLLQAPASQLVGVTKAYGEKDGSAAPATAEAPAEAAAEAAAPEAAPAE